MTKTRLAPELARVQRAAGRRRDSDREYLESLCAARLAGRSASQIAEVAGVSRQAVLKMTSA